MEKYGVATEQPETCPICGRVLSEETNPPSCPVHGTQGIEKSGEDEDGEDNA